MKTFVVTVIAGLLVVTVAGAAEAAPKQGGTQSAAVKRGEYLVMVGGCNHCHSPKKMGPKGPEPDEARLLSGHPEAMQMPPPPAPQGPWAIAISPDLTAWAGPWGVTFAANLTPDAETGLGKWTVQNFVEAMRTGRHQGRGRQILPPMPWQDVGKMTDADLKAMFAYLRSVPAVRNRVPDPIASAQAGAGAPGAATQGTGSAGVTRPGAAPQGTGSESPHPIAPPGPQPGGTAPPPGR